MLLSTFRLVSICFLLLLALCTPAGATHIVGAEISYAPTFGSGPTSDPRRLTVRVKVYRDAYTSVNFLPTIALYCRRNGCAAADPANMTVQLNRYSTSFAPSTRCAGGPVIEQQEFGGEITLSNWGDWTLSLAEENRNTNIFNIANSSSYGLYADAQVRLTPGITNTSPVFTSTLLPYICGNQFHRFSFATFDADGDSLVYQIALPQAASSFDPCPRTMMMVPAPHFTIGAATGELATVPFTLNVGNYVMAVRVEEFRRLANQWTRIGSVMRDIMYPVSAGNGNRNPTFAGASGGQPTAQVVQVNPGRTVSVTLTATDPDASQTLRFSSEGIAAIPGAVFQSISTTQARLTWQVPAIMPAGRYTIPVAATDNACPVNGTTTETVTFQVTNEILAITSGRAQVLSAYPMPFRSQVQFRLPTPGVQPVYITDGLGRLITTLQSSADGSVKWAPAAEVPPGAYFARQASGEAVFRLLRE